MGRSDEGGRSVVGSAGVLPAPLPAARLDGGASAGGGERGGVPQRRPQVAAARRASLLVPSSRRRAPTPPVSLHLRNRTRQPQRTRHGHRRHLLRPLSRHPRSWPQVSLLPSSRIPHPCKLHCRKLFWWLYLAGLSVIGVSRVFIAAHFLHQIVLGGLCGILLGRLVSRGRLESWGRAQLLALSALLAVTGVAAHEAIQAAGYDPHWSLHSARRACLRPQSIHASTTPLSALFRDLAVLLTLAALLPLLRGKPSSRMRALTASALGFLAVQALKHCMPFPEQLSAFYAVYAAFTAAVIAVPILFTAFLCGKKPKRQ